MKYTVKRTIVMKVFNVEASDEDEAMEMVADDIDTYEDDAAFDEEWTVEEQ